MTKNIQSYGFKLKGDFQDHVASIHSIGKELRQHEPYRWDGLSRNEAGKIVFQYTLSGTGAIRINQTTTRLNTGDAFLVTLPSDHCYYLPDDADHWSFIYITLYGEQAQRLLTQLVTTKGHIYSLAYETQPIQCLLDVLDKIDSLGVNNGYELSRYAYTFLMELLQYLEQDQVKAKTLPSAIARAVKYIETHFHEDIALQDIVVASRLSTYHFTRLFHRTMGVTPIKYLTKVRLTKAVTLLKNHELTIEEIAKHVGFNDANYFSKVFKKALDVTPSTYRNSTSFMPINHIFLD